MCRPTCDASRSVRGLVVRLDGRLKRVVRQKAPPLLEQYGIKYLYEAWILSHADGTPKQAAC